MNESQPTKEFRFKRGRPILEYIRKFSATEKVIFAVLVLIALSTTLFMVADINSMFLVKVPGQGGTLREGLVGLPRTINPVLAVTDADRDISSLIYSGLMKYEKGAIIPDLAKSYKVSDDGLTYTFILKKDAEFQDGVSVTADDIAFTIQKIQDSVLKSPRRNDWVDVSVKVNSPTEVQFTLKKPYAPFLANTTIGILPKHIWQDVSDEQFVFTEYNLKPIGSGPFKFHALSKDSGGIPNYYELSSWRSDFERTALIDYVSFNFYADEEKALSALDRGEIDSLSAVSPEVASKLAADSAQAYEVLSAPLPRIFGVFFNQGQAAVLADKNVRYALDMAVDRQAILKNVLFGYGTAIESPLPVSFGLSEASKSKQNLDGATALLERNGWKKNSEGVYEKKSGKTVLTLSFDIYTADSPDLKAAAEMVKNDWNKLGANVGVKIFETSDLYQNVIRTRKYDALLFGEFVGKDRDLYAFWHSSQIKSPGLNVAMYANSKADKLLEDIRSASSEKLRDTKFTEWDKLVYDDTPAVFLYSPDYIYVIPKELKGISLADVTVPSDRWNGISDWYLNTEKIWKFFTKSTK